MKRPKAPTYKHNDLFRPGPVTALNACVGRNGGPYDFYAYSRGYFRAAELLAETLIEDGHLIDLVVYPLVFTYRHAAELAIKDLVRLLPRLWDEKREAEFSHKLLDNWNNARPYLKRAPVFDPDDPAVDEVDKVLLDLVEIDPEGAAFRFPEARKGSRFLQDLSLINIPVFASALHDVGEAFECWHVIAIDSLQAKYESEREGAGEEG